MVTPTAGYQAGTEANQAQVSFGIEATWGTKPSVAFQALRMTSETLKLNRTRQRPLEIITTREASAAVTTQQQAGGAINFGFSYGTFDDPMDIVLGAERSADLAIAGVAADITITHVSGTTATLSSGTSGKFTSIALGQWIRLLGFTNAANNGIWYVSAKASNTSLTLEGDRPSPGSVTETPATTLAQIRGSTIINGTEFRSAWLQKQFSSTLFLEYPGAFFSQMTLSGRLGQFFSGALTVIAKDEVKATSNQSTGAVIAAPGGRIISPVSGFMALKKDFTDIGVTIDQLDLSIVNTGAAGEFGLGSAAAQGMLQGYLEASGSFRAYFPDFSIYDDFVSEGGHNLAFQVQDNNTDAYVISLLSAAFSDGAINAGGPGQPVYATYQFQADPRAAGGTIQIDKLPST